MKPVLTSRAGAGEWNQGDIARTLDGDGQRALVPSARSELSTWLDLASLTDVSTEPCDILVVNMLDIVDAECADLAPGRIASAAWTSPTRPAAGPTSGSVAIASLTLGTAETGPWSPAATVAIASGPGWASKPRSLRAAFIRGTGGTATVAVVRTI